MNFNLKNHLFAVEAFFDFSLVLSFAVPKKNVEKHIPHPLELDLFQDEWAFFTVACVQAKHLRPAGWPRIFGRNFFLVGNRYFVKYKNQSGKRLRGLLIRQSETNQTSMKMLGNIFTHYNYSKTDVVSKIDNNEFHLSSKQSEFSFAAKLVETPKLPDSSVFENWKEARRFSGPLPFTFTVQPKNKILIVEGVRQNWKPIPLEITQSHFELEKRFNIKDARLSNAFLVKNIPYRWKKGKVEIWS